MFSIKRDSEWFSKADFISPRLYPFTVFVVTCLERKGRKTCYHYRKGLRRLTWKEARYECMNSETDLISIRDRAEQEHIHSWLLQIQFSDDDRSIFLGELLFHVIFSDYLPCLLLKLSDVTNRIYAQIDAENCSDSLSEFDSGLPTKPIDIFSSFFSDASFDTVHLQKLDADESRYLLKLNRKLILYSDY